jgi:hypothetical protein
MPDQVPGPRENTGKKQAHNYGAGCPHFNGSLLELRAVTLTGVTEDDIFRIAIARHFGTFKPNSSVPCEADMCVPVQERILIVKSDVVEFQNHAKHMLVIIRIPRCERPQGLAPGRDQRAVIAARGCPSWDFRLRPACWADPVRDDELHSTTPSGLIRRM